MLIVPQDFRTIHALSKTTKEFATQVKNARKEEEMQLEIALKDSASAAYVIDTH